MNNLPVPKLILSALIAILFGLPAQASEGPALKTRAVAVWYLNTDTAGTFMQYRVEAVRQEAPASPPDLEVTVTRNRCSESETYGSSVLECPYRFRRAWASTEGRLTVEPDISGADLLFTVKGKEFHVAWSEVTQSGAWDKIATCGDAADIAGGVFWKHCLPKGFVSAPLPLPNAESTCVFSGTFSRRIPCGRSPRRGGTRHP
jgi:hypothetical protein